MMISVFDYMDVRLFLQDYFREEKAKDPKFSYAGWAIALGFSNKTILRMILQGKRQITPKSLAAFKQHLILTPLELEYFEVLVDYSQCKTSIQRQAIGARLIAVQRKNLQMKVVPPASGILKNAFGPLVMTLVSSAESPVSSEKLAALLNIPTEQVQEILKELCGTDLILVQDGLYKAAHNTFKITDHFGNAGLRNFYEYWIERSSKAIDLPAEVRRFRSLQVALSKEEFEEAVTRLNEFAVSLISRFERNTITDRNLYMINSAVFPVTNIWSGRGI